jgi:TonB family protein
MVAMRFLLFAFLSSFLVVAHAAKKDAFTTTIQWRLSLDANGQIDGLKPVNPDYLPEVRKQIEPIVHTWHFTPGRLAGRPAPTETTLGVRVAFEAESTNAIQYHVRIVSAGTGGTYMHVVKPNYPEVSQRSHAEGEVVLWIKYDADGVVTSVRNVPEMNANGTSPALTDAAIDAVKQWTFRPETVAGRGVASEALVPICFKLRDEPCHWKPRPDKRPMQSGEAVALSSVVGLETGEAHQLP